ncbi:MAG: AAA family ATPase [Lachnospiraceae bacterium]|nr:AAA family ATPase [Lachnospiraceae bacterium]
MQKDTKVIAVAGKGGVGKTSLAAAMVKVLAERYPDKRILAIDADPAVGLSTALGVEVHETIDDIRKAVVATVEDGDTRTALELLAESEYRIYDAMTECGGFVFLAVGRPESAGCYCRVNNYLKAVIQLLSDNFDYVVIDGEAGIEQINRRVMEKVTHLLLVTDTSRKGTQVIQTLSLIHN